MITTSGLAKLWHRVFYSLTVRGIFHCFAMVLPFNSLRIFFYRLRGTKIGKNVWIGKGTFLEESRPELIVIEDDVKIERDVIIVTHDSSYHGINPKIPIRRGKVVVKRGAHIGKGSVILPGVTVGENSVICAGSVVVRDIPPSSVAVGRPAKVQRRRE